MKKSTLIVVTPLCIGLWMGGVAAQSPQSTTTPAVPSQAKPAPAKPITQLNDLDAFMAKVLERRNDNWKTLHDYILSEREQSLLSGPGGTRLDSLDREYHWFIRDGFLIRSPVKANGVSLSKAERERYEQDWLAHEKRREQRQKERAARLAAAKGTPAPAPPSDTEIELSDISGQTGEPRFISEAYFMRFPFEPGNYYLVGREKMEGRDVVKIEYYPSRLFHDHPQQGRSAGSANSAGGGRAGSAGTPAKKTTSQEAKDAADARMEAAIQQNMNKVSRVTMWIDPQEHQIVQYAFDNVDFGFLPYRMWVQIDEARASMTMGRYFGDVWLPKSITMRAGGTVANGNYTFTYDRSFYDYQKGEVSARIRAYVGKDDK